MSAASDIDDVALVDDGAGILPFACHGGEGIVAVEVGKEAGIVLQLFHACHGGIHQVGVKAGFEHAYALFGTHNLVFVLLQFLGDVAFSAHQCLFAYPFFRNGIAIGVAYLDIVSENIVEAYFQTCNAGTFDFALLDVQQIVLSGALDFAVVIKFRAHSCGYHPTFCHHHRRIGQEFAFDALAEFGTVVQFFSDAADAFLRRCTACILQHHYGFESHAQLFHLTGIDACGGHFRDHALHVAHLAQFHFAELAEFRMAEEMFYAVEAVVDVVYTAQWEENPSLQLPCSHGCAGLVENLIE